MGVENKMVGENIIVDEASYVYFYLNRIIPSAYVISSSTTCPHPSRATSIKQDSVRQHLLLINNIFSGKSKNNR